jgi:hypothetical protein
VRSYLLLAVVIGAVMVFRLATAEIVNDDYQHLSAAQQIVLGNVPVRDFIDPGEFLFNYTSAAAQVLLGRRLLSEVLLDVTVLTLGHALVFVLAWRASGSRLIALLVTAPSVVLVTRLYSYPKIFLYALALAVIWRYADDRRTRTLVWAAICTAVIFLFRHDHGARIGVTMAVMLAMVHWPDGWQAVIRKIGVYGGVTALLLLPFFVFVQTQNAGYSYWRNMLQSGRTEYERTVGPVPQFHLEPGGMLFDEQNALAWFYYLTILLPWLTLLILARDAYRDRRGAAAGVSRSGGPEGRPLRATEDGKGTAAGPRPWAMRHEAQKMTAVAVLAIVMHLYLLRAASESAIADVSTTTAVLGAWLLARGLVPALRRSAPMTRTLGPAAASLAVVAATLAFIRPTEGAAAVRTLIADVRGGNGLFRRIDEFSRIVPPYEDEGARYVFACTEESDQLLVASEFAPHAYYAAGRGFAAGRLYFLISVGPSPELHAFSARRLREERVPIVLVNPPDYDAFARGYESIYQYLVQHYREAGTTEFDDSVMKVLVDTRIPPVGTWGPQRLPCFRAHE